MKGRLFGVGVGPGDPELMTYKAVRIIKECQVLAVPARDRKHAVSYRIAAEMIENMEEKEFLDMYIHRIVKAKGYETTIISGIPSFCAAAARLDDSLVDRAEELHVIPSSYGIEAALNYSGTKILMKSASGISEVKRTLEEKDGNVNVKMIENCGMPEERIYERIEDVPEQAGYYSLLIVKESEKER